MRDPERYEQIFFVNGELKDKEIVYALKRASKDYKNGEIDEVRSLLWAIISAIDEWEDMYCG